MILIIKHLKKSGDFLYTSCDVLFVFIAALNSFLRLYESLLKAQVVFPCLPAEKNKF